MKETEFKLNEPVKEIKGGTRRKSTIVDLKKYGRIVRRIELNQLLMLNCPDKAKEAIGSIKVSDHEILRVMAQETIISRNNPTTRRKAIHFLGHFPTRENINFLSDLVEFGDDHYIRGEALTAVSKSNLSLGLPILVNALSRKHQFEVNRAFNALVEYGRNNGDDKIYLLYKKERKLAIKKQLKMILDQIKNQDNPRIKGNSKEDDNAFKTMLGPGSKGFSD